jgi:hypothetical protein
MENRAPPGLALSPRQLAHVLLPSSPVLAVYYPLTPGTLV